MCLGVPSPHELTPFCLKQTINPDDVGALNLILLEILSRGHMETIWGLDLGTTSIGFAVVRMDIKKAQGEIIKTGVRIFPEGVNPEKNQFIPRNKRRRDMRLHRRQLRRRRIRRIELSRKFKEMTLLPDFASDALESTDGTGSICFEKKWCEQKTRVTSIWKSHLSLGSAPGIFE